MALKVKELNDDVQLNIQVNKAYYIMLKNSLMFILNQEAKDRNQAEVLAELDKLKEMKYEEMTPFQRTFYTITLAIAEIENIASNDPTMHTEVEIPEKGEEGYVEPNLD
jgi:hypothetical protein